MKRLAVPLAAGLLAVTTGAVLAFNPLPDEAGPGLERAAEHAGRTLPARPASLPDAVQAIIDAVPNAADAAEAAAHGAAVSDAAKAEDTTPDTNHGADVSAVAKDNHGAATAAEHKPADVGKPESVPASLTVSASLRARESQRSRASRMTPVPPKAQVRRTESAARNIRLAQQDPARSPVTSGVFSVGRVSYCSRRRRTPRIDRASSAPGNTESRRHPKGVGSFVCDICAPENRLTCVQRSTNQRRGSELSAPHFDVRGGGRSAPT